MRQMLADTGVFSSSTLTSVPHSEKNEDLRKQHAVLQQIKAENEAMRVLRGYDEKGQEYTMREGLVQLSKEELAILEQTIQGEQKKTAALIARTEKRGEGEGEYMKFLKSQEAQLNALTRGIDFNTGAVELNDTGFKGLMGTIKQVAGAYYQTERAVRTVEAADKDALQVRYQIQNINRQLGTLQRMQKADKYDLIQLTEMEVDASERLLPILRQIQQAEEDSTEQKRLMAQAIEVLTMENKGLGKELKEILALQYQTSKQMQTDMERARAAQKSASIGIANLAGIVFGMGNSTASAMASMAMMSTQIMSAGSAAFKSSRDMVTLQAKIYAVQMDAKLANTRLAAMTGSLAKFFALAKLAAPVLAVGAAFYIIGKNAESARKAIEDLNEATQTTTSTLDRMQSTTKIFSDQEGLANALGISNYEMKDLAGNADLTKELLDKVSNHGLNLSGALEQAALESKQLLQYLHAIQTNARILDEGEFAAGFAALRDEMKGFSGFIEFLQFDTDKAEEIDKFYDLLGLSGRRQEFETGTNYLRVFVRDLEQIMRAGRVLSQEELDLVSAFFGDDEEIMAQIYRLNGLVMSGDMARITMEEIARAAEETGGAAAGMATDIENLTQEIYNFSGAREELFFGGQFGNVTGSLYKQVVTQGVGTLYHKNEVIMSNNFHGFFNEREAAAKIIAVLDEYSDRCDSMRTVDRRFTFWMAGYYDDFLGAVALPDDLNDPSLDYKSHKTHAGNAITGYAPMNPRYAHAFVEREDGATGRFNNAVLTGGAQYKVNAGIHDWLGFDANRRAAGTYVGKAQLQFPDSITNANRQKYDAGADYGTIPQEGYLMFCNGYDTTGRYYAAIGTDDSTFGRDDADSPDRNSSSTLRTTAGLPANQSTPTKAVRTHVAGVYSGELLDYGNIDNGAPRDYIYPIKSPSGGNFLVTEIFTSSSTYDPVLAYDGTLNSKGTGDIFTIRLHACAVDTSSARVKLRIGGEGDAMTSSSSGETGFSNAAIEVEIQPVAFDEDGFSSYSQPTLTSVWDDYDIIIDYDAYTYDLYKNGAQVSTGNAISNKSDGTAFDPADMTGGRLTPRTVKKKPYH